MSVSCEQQLRHQPNWARKTVSIQQEGSRPCTLALINAKLKGEVHLASLSSLYPNERFVVQQQNTHYEAES